MDRVDSLRTGDKFKKTEIGEIPVDWEVVELSSLAASYKNAFVDGPFGSNLKLRDYIESGVPVLQGKNITLDRLEWLDIRYVSKEKANELSRSFVKVGDILMTKIGTVGCSAIVDNLRGHEVALIPANLMKISLDEERVDVNYLYQWLVWQKTKNRIIDIASQTAQPALSLKVMRSFKVTLPPLPEQKKIAEVLSTIDQAVEKNKEIIEKTKELKKGLMRELLTRGIGHKKFKKTEVGEIPVEWKIELISKTCDINPPKKEIDSLRDVKEVSFLPMEFVREDGEGIMQMEIRKISEVIRGYTYFRENDVLFAKITPCMENGKIAIVSNLKNGIGFGSTEFHVLRPSINILLPKILFYWMERKSFRDFATNFFTGTAGQQRVQKGFFDVVKIPLPSLPEQHKIAEILKSVDDEIEEDRKSLDKLQNLKKGLMQRLLTGKVRVRI